VAVRTGWSRNQRPGKLRPASLILLAKMRAPPDQDKLFTVMRLVTPGYIHAG